jgi:PAS domain S-box-containing protein
MVDEHNLLNNDTPSSSPAGETSRATQALLDAEERFRLLIDSAHDYAIFFVDVENRIVDWNIGAERIVGYSEEEAVGQLGSIIFTPEDIEAGAHEAELHTATREGRAQDERWHVRRDGELFWASGVLMALREADGRLIGYAKVLRDFTQRRCAEEERDRLLESEQKARTEAEAAKRARDKFIGVISHELRSPLQTILGWVDLLCSGQLDEETSARAIETIQRNAALQNRLINDLLDITRIEAGTLQLNLAPLALHRVVDAVINNVSPAADAKGVALHASVPSDIASIQGDEERLQQVITNLLNNALKFTPEGGAVQVCVEQADSQVLIHVCDSGIGINPDFLPRIFDPYTQAESSASGEKHGLGLGLSIVRELVGMHGGTVRVHSEGEGRGSTFTVCLPLHV